jgi:hypothetical protein
MRQPVTADASKTLIPRQPAMPRTSISPSSTRAWLIAGSSSVGGTSLRPSALAMNTGAE